eukprot:353725-Chlamydomonas_euryale.AAC.1
MDAGHTLQGTSAIEPDIGPAPQGLQQDVPAGSGRGPDTHAATDAVAAAAAAEAVAAAAAGATVAAAAVVPPTDEHLHAGLLGRAVDGSRCGGGAVGWTCSVWMVSDIGSARRVHRHSVFLCERVGLGKFCNQSHTSHTF